MTSTSKLTAALKTLVEAIPEDLRGAETSEASDLLYGFIEHPVPVAAPGPDRLSRQMIMPLDPPGEFAGGVVVAAIRLPVDLSLHPKRHAIVVKHEDGERETFSVHEVSWNSIQWGGGQGRYDLGYAEALQLMTEKATG